MYVIQHHGNSCIFVYADRNIHMTNIRHFLSFKICFCWGGGSYPRDVTAWRLYSLY